MNWRSFYDWFPYTVTRKSNAVPQRVEQGEQTGRQDLYPFSLLAGGAYPLRNLVSGYSNPPEASLFTYRWIERCPTVALAYSIARAPVLAAPYSVQADKDAPSEWKELVEKVFTGSSMLPDLLRGMFRAASLRFAPFEVIWGVNEDGYQVPIAFKNLIQENTVIVISEDTGEIVGVRQGDNDLIGAKHFLYVNEPDRIPIYGYSRSENIREDAWWPWKEGMQRGGQLDRKAAGMVFSVLVPNADEAIFSDSNNPGGAKLTGAQVGLNIANLLQQGISVALPNSIHRVNGPLTPEAIKILAGLSAFQVQYHDLGNVGPSNDALLRKLQHYEALMFRGWYLPERSGLEGTHGTKAEAGEHAEFVDQDAEQTRQDFAEAISQGPINWMLQFNFGIKARDKVRLVASPIKDAKLEVFRVILDGLLKSGKAGLVARFTNMRSVYDQLGIPISEKAAKDIDDPMNWLGQEQEASDDQKQPVNNQNGKQNGNGKAIKRLSRWLGNV